MTTTSTFFHVSQIIYAVYEIHIWQSGSCRLIVPSGSKGAVRGVAQSDYYIIDWFSLSENTVHIHASCLTTTPPTP